MVRLCQIQQVLFHPAARAPPGSLTQCVIEIFGFLALAAPRPLQAVHAVIDVSVQQSAVLVFPCQVSSFIISICFMYDRIFSLPYLLLQQAVQGIISVCAPCPAGMILQFCPVPKSIVLVAAQRLSVLLHACQPLQPVIDIPVNAALLREPPALFGDHRPVSHGVIGITEPVKNAGRVRVAQFFQQACFIVMPPGIISAGASLFREPSLPVILIISP